jgi:PAP2 superfamily protein
MWRDGVPVGRERLLLWIVLGLLALSTANVGGWFRGVVFEWLPLALVLAVYDVLRGHADGLLFSAWYRPQIEADAFLFGGTVPTVWLQEKLWDASHVHWYDYAAWAVYVSYFVATYLVAALLWFFARDQFRRYVGCVALLAGMAYVTFALFPAAPPWLASRSGELEYTTRLIGPISAHIPFLSLSFEGLFERGWEYANPVAAVPSLHAAYTLLITLFLWRSTRWGRPLLALYPAAMAFALVYTAEHYLVDILLGWAYTLLAIWIVDRIASALERRKLATVPR